MNGKHVKKLYHKDISHKGVHILFESPRIFLASGMSVVEAGMPIAVLKKKNSC